MQVHVVHPYIEKYPLEKLVFRNFSIAEVTSDTLPALAMMYSADIAIVSAAAKSSIQKINFYTAVKMKYIFILLIYIVV